MKTLPRTTTATAPTTLSPPAPVVKPASMWRSRIQRTQFLTAMVFIAPWVIGLLAFIIYPIAYTVYLSFTRYGGFNPPVYIGIDNYTRMFQDEIFRLAIWNTLFYTFLAVPIGVAVAMLLAIAMNQPVREIAIYRVILYLPSVLPIFALSFIFWALLDPNQGIVNEFLRLIGINPPNWFGNVHTAKPALVLMAQFSAGQIALVFLAGLKGIPHTLHEAAMIDGAGSLSRFRNITLPLMTPVILYDLILGISLGLQVFTQSFIITAGGPANSTKFLVYYIYDNAFRFGGNMGYASAIGVFLFVLTFVIAYGVFRTSSRWVHYELS
ncbi:MAG TPA: sugar ABC transporter permease [Thermomicrobiales bacterium]|nr:sugar ABC transporter permease [Thermomicrobiales bacterium]